MIHTLRAADAPEAKSDIAAIARMGEPAGASDAISLTDRYVTRNGEPWFPVMGEYHFSRDSSDRWETELLKMKAGGVTVVATYLLWIVHEERRGRLRWDGERDIRRFLQLAHRHGLDVMLRIGPWAHGETRNGGFPEWVQQSGFGIRTNDPAYQELVRAWYAAVADQVRDFLRTEDAPENPVIGVQCDNELYDQPEHLEWLRSAAEAAGISAPLWTATGWGGALLPPDLMPIYAGYSDGFWEASDILWPSFAHTHFEFSAVRDDLTVGADVRTSEVVAREQDDRYPWVTCELGGGMAIAYHRRPLVAPDDVASLALVKLGSGSAWQGYYLYHGGTQVIGEDTTTQESHDTGYPNDMPQLDYDFYAPIGAHGQLREHYHLLRQQHLFLHRYGSELLGATSTIAALSAGVPRWAYRGDSGGGYVFVNNHQPAADPLSAVDDIQLRVELAEGAVTLPTAPTTIAGGSYFFWPVRRSFGSLPAVSATVQPVTEIRTETGTLVLVSATAGIPVEFVLEGIEPEHIRGGRVTDRADGRIVVTPDAEPGLETVLQIGDTRFLVLDPHSASRVWRGEVAGVDTIAIWEEGLLFDKGLLTLLAKRPQQTLHTLPALPANHHLEGAGETASGFSRYTVRGPQPASGEVSIALRAQATGTTPVRHGGSADRLSAPHDDDFAAAASIDLTVPPVTADPADDALLSVRWTGDAARAHLDGRVVADQFWYGREWDIALPHPDAETVVTVEALPFAPDTAVFVAPEVRGDLHDDRPIVQSATVVVTRTITATS